MSSRRVVLWSVIAVLVSAQLVVLYTWARPRIVHLYTPPNIIQNIEKHDKQFASLQQHHNSSQHKDPHSLLARIASTVVQSQGSFDTDLSSEELTPHVIDSTTLSHLFQSAGPTWKAGTFCDDFLQRRYHTHVQVCGKGTAQINCFWNPLNAHAATCDIESVMVRPKKFWSAMDNVQGTFPHSGAVRLLKTNTSSCEAATIHHLANTMEGGDYVKWVVHDLISNPPLHQTDCQHWINETVFLFSSHAHHIYFRFLAYYAIHKSLLDHRVQPGEYRIFRVTEGFNYLFPDYERALFPSVQPMTDLPDASICFKKVVLVPKCYATIFFQCKMQYEIRDKCFHCDGRGLSGTSLMSFRTRVLAACGLKDDVKKEESHAKLIAVILRKPYTRWKGDHPSRFERVLTNSDELIASLHKSFPNSIVKALHMEDLSVCEQVGYTHDADLLIGVHGAGLVHLWWLREDALMMELEPSFEVGNPSFRTLAKLTGRRYVGVRIRGSSGGVTVNVGDVINQIKSHTNIT